MARLLSAIVWRDRLDRGGMNWMAYNFADEVALPASIGAPVSFLMYPQAETADDQIDSLDPDSFQYEITSREITRSIN